MLRDMKRCTLIVAVAAGLTLSGAPAHGSPGDAGRWRAPVPGPVRVLRAFDPPAERWLAGHRGVDLAAPVGSPVLAAGAGRISFAGLLAGRGVVVVVHGELRTTYEPVRAAVAVNERVASGHVLGTLQPGHDPARPAAGVLHWGLRRGEIYLDPMSLVSVARPVRLLPHWQAESPTSRDGSATATRHSEARASAAAGSEPPRDPPERPSAPYVAAGLGALALAGAAAAARPPP